MDATTASGQKQTSRQSNEVGVPLLDEDFLILSTIHSAKGQEWASGRFLERVRDWCAKHQPPRSPNFQTWDWAGL